MGPRGMRSILLFIFLPQTLERSLAWNMLSRPVPLDWDKHRTNTGSSHALHTPPPQSSPPMALSGSTQASSMIPTRVFRFPACPSGDVAFEPDESVPEPKPKT
ncbi:uncharacterized protein DAT39_023412, partial [Clarias magur]